MRYHRTIRFGVRKLIEIVERESNYELNDKEKQTLFISSVKLFSSYTKLADEAWRLMCKYLKLSGVDIFEMNDKRGNGMEYRVLDNWPTHLKEWRADPSGNSK